jgi:hypothetical protein
VKTTAPAPHPYVGDGIADFNGHDRCAWPRCGLAEARRDVHEMPEVAREVVEVEERRMGERT